MNYKKRIKLLRFIGEIMTTSDEGKKYIYEIMSNLELIKLGTIQLSRNIIKIENKHENAIIATRIYSTDNLELLIQAIIMCNNKEEHSNLIKMIMHLVVVGSKNSIFSNHKITATRKGFKVESKGFFSKISYELTPAMLEYVITNGEKKKNSKGSIPSDVVDSLIKSTLEFNSSKNNHDKFLQACGKSSIQSVEGMESELENTYKIKNKIPNYIIDLAYNISLGNIVIVRNEILVISYKNREHQIIRTTIDLWEYKFFLNSLLRGESLVAVIANLTVHTVKKI